jgi:ATP-dependent Clp protease ATP-binding subunit ClpA
LDRLDEVIQFTPHNEAGIMHIINQMLEEIRDELSRRDVSIAFADEVSHFLLSQVPEGKSARPLRTVIREHIEDPLSLELLSNGNGEPIVVTVDEGKVIFARPVPIA